MYGTHILTLNTLGILDYFNFERIHNKLEVSHNTWKFTKNMLTLSRLYGHGQYYAKDGASKVGEYEVSKRNAS